MYSATQSIRSHDTIHIMVITFSGKTGMAAKTVGACFLNNLRIF